MSTLRKMAEARKAAILGNAERQAAEVDREMEELERLASKYGLSVTAPAVPAGKPIGTIGLQPGMNALEAILVAVHDSLLAFQDASITKRARVAATAYIRAKNKPVLLAELCDALEQNGVKFQGETPRSTLSAILGQDPGLYSISRSKGWWLKGVPVPEEPARTKIVLRNV